MKNNKYKEENERLVEKGLGISQGDEDPMTPPNERPKRFLV